MLHFSISPYYIPQSLRQYSNKTRANKFILLPYNLLRRHCKPSPLIPGTVFVHALNFDAQKEIGARPVSAEHRSDQYASNTSN
jgi:hypothetical protein